MARAWRAENGAQAAARKGATGPMVPTALDVLSVGLRVPPLVRLAAALAMALMLRIVG